MARILIIDDDESLLALMERSLLRAKHEVRTAANGRDARRLVACEEFDAVVTDIVMPQCDGIEFIGELRQLRPGLPVIAVSGNGRMMAVHLKAARCLGAVSYLEKPFTLEHLLDTITRVTTRCPPASDATPGVAPIASDAA